MSGTLDWVGIQDWNSVNICDMSGAMYTQGEASGCLSVWIWKGYEWKGTFQSIIILAFIGLYTNWGTWGN